MRRIFLSLFFFSFVFSAFSFQHPNPSRLTIYLHDHGVFNIRIGDQEYNQYTNEYTFPNLRPGRHYVEIIRYERVQSGQSYTYVHPRKIFSDFIRIPAGADVEGYIDRRQRYREVERRPYYAQPSYPGKPVDVYPTPLPPYYQPVGMSREAFIHLKSTLDNTSFDSNRVKIAKQAIAANYVRSWQVKELLSHFSFESNRLELAKFAYPYTLDKQNYFMVNDGFRFSSSSERLNRHIMGLTHY